MSEPTCLAVPEARLSWLRLAGCFSCAVLAVSVALYWQFNLAPDTLEVSLMSPQCLTYSTQ